ncbi:MAG: DUF4270 family protein [Bacteroidetes bacterium]|nr:DUF4270 family protein [Bacteroidota bacterium]
MKQLPQAAFLALTISLAALFSCNDPTVIGSDLLSGDQLDIDFTDTITLKARTVLDDSIRIWDPSPTSIEFVSFPFGDFIDPVFGRSTTSIYAQLNLNTSAPDFMDGELDSIVLILPYDSSLCYGKFDEVFAMGVYRLDEPLIDSISYYNTDSFSVKPSPIAVKFFTPNVEDSVTVIVPEGDPDTTITERLVPHLRIRLDDAFAEEFFETDTSIFNHNDEFLEFFKGIWLKPASQNAGMLSFNMRNSLAGLRVYYHEDTIHRQYNLRIYSGNPVTSHQRHYYGGSFAEAYISPANSDSNDSLLFLQGLTGLDLEFEIPYAESMKGVIINKAEIVLPILSLLEDDPAYDPVEQIFVTEVLTDSTSRSIDDLTFSIDRGGTKFGDYFGGQVTTENNYKINISAHFQDMIAGLVGKKLQLTVYLKPERPNRVVLAGPTHFSSPPKLKVSFTRY